MVDRNTRSATYTFVLHTKKEGTQLPIGSPSDHGASIMVVVNRIDPVLKQERGELKSKTIAAVHTAH